MKIRSTLLGLVGIVATIPMFANAAVCTDTYRDGECIYGEHNDLATPSKTVDLTQTRSIAVPYGQTVKFVNGDRSFTWTFDGAESRAVPLSKIAPPGIDTHMAAIYIGANPLITP